MLQIGFYALWGFVSIGVVGMAYLLSVLAPWHWGQGHRVQAFFCALGVLIATSITTWNSLAFRSRGFVAFKTDEWVWNAWPQLRDMSISVTMILVAVAPPFWGLFWAIVQPTQTGRSLRQLHESHAQKLLRTQQEAELKSLRAEANAKVRAAQLRGMAATASAAREQAKQVFGRSGGSATAASAGNAASETDETGEADTGEEENTGNGNGSGGSGGTGPVSASPALVSASHAPVASTTATTAPPVSRSAGRGSRAPRQSGQAGKGAGTEMATPLTAPGQQSRVDLTHIRMPGANLPTAYSAASASAVAAPDSDGSGGRPALTIIG